MHLTARPAERRSSFQLTEESLLSLNTIQTVWLTKDGLQSDHQIKSMPLYYFVHHIHIGIFI